MRKMLQTSQNSKTSPYFAVQERLSYLARLIPFFFFQQQKTTTEKHTNRTLFRSLLLNQAEGRLNL